MAAPTTLPPAVSRTAAPMAAHSTFATAASLVARADAALITPYVYPAGCEYQYKLYSGSQETRGEGLIVETYLYVDTADAAWKTCQPAGLTTGYDEAFSLDHVYRRAVCPSGWMAFGVGMNTYKQGSETWNSARCCKLGDKLVDDIWGLNYEYAPSASSLCASTAYATHLPPGTFETADWAAASTRSAPFASTRRFRDSASASTWTSTWTVTTDVVVWTPRTASATFKSAHAYYPPWSIEWVNADNTAMQPKWPDMTSDMLIPTWTPGTAVEAGVYDNKGEGPREKGPAYIQLKIAIPIIAILGFVIVAVPLATVCLRWWKKRAAVEGKLKVQLASDAGPEGMAGNGAVVEGGEDRVGSEEDLVKKAEKVPVSATTAHVNP